jgi:hypothetical protein
MKYWGLIVVSRPHIFSLGDHENTDVAMAFAEEFVDKKNAEKLKEAEEKQIPENERPPNHDLLWILDESDMRNLTGEVHRPYHIPKPKREPQTAEAPVRHGRANPRLIAAAENQAEGAAAPAEDGAANEVDPAGV